MVFPASSSAGDHESCTFILPVGVYGTIWIMLIAYLTRFMPYGLRYNTTSMLQIHQELENPPR